MTPTSAMATLLTRLRAAIEHLAWPPARQRRYLSELGVAPMVDELALEFDDAFRPVEPLLCELRFNAEELESLLAIDNLLRRMSSATSEDVWGWDALDELPAWAELRRLAERVLGGLP